MIDGKTVVVTVPAYNEGRLIRRTLATIPEFVDGIIVVDDKSEDSTLAEAKAAAVDDARIYIIERDKNGGVGAAIVDGYRAFLRGEGDICVVMAGDAQMDPDDLAHLLAPLVEDRCDYAKGNRLLTRDVAKVMPKDRYLGNIIFTALTKWASGYWHVVDSQCGYTAVSRATLQNLDLDAVFTGYGVPNDLLIRLNVAQARVCDVPVRAIYGEEVSGIQPFTTIPRISMILIKGFWWRMWQRYVLRDFHPLVLLYAFGFLLVLLGLMGGFWLTLQRVLFDHSITSATVVLDALCLLIGFQSVLFAMTFDMLHNADLKVRS
ncbi:MAG: glycosyltransferase family 2 protein [Planctomycetota bacterium]